MNIIGESSTNDESFVIRNTGNAEAKSLIDDLRREVESGRTRWFAVIGAGVPTPDVATAERTAGVTLDRSPIQPIEYDGRRFASTAELRRYQHQQRAK